MSKADVAAGRAYVSIFVKNNISKTLDKIKTELSEIGSAAMSAGAKFTGVGLAITGSLTAAVMHFANVGSELNDMSKRTGLSTTAIVELGYAAKMTGKDIGTVEVAVKKMQKSLGEIGPESKSVAAAMEQIGLSVKELSGLKPEDQFQAIAEGIAAVEDPTRRAALAMTIFGKSGTDLLPMIEDIKALRAEAKELGIAPSPESIAAADAIGDAIDKLKAVVSAAMFEIGAAVAPSMLGIITSMIEAAKQVRQFIARNHELIVAASAVGVALISVGTALYAVGIAFKLSAGAIGIAVTAIGVLKTVVSGVAAVFGAFRTASTLLGTALQSLLAASLIATAGATATLATTQAAASVVVTTYAGLLTAAASSTALLGITSGLTTSALIAQSTAMIGASAASGGMILSSGGASAGMLSLSGSSLIAAAGLGTFTTAGGVMATAWTGISGVMAAAWGVIMGPITPFVIAGAAIVAVMTAIGAAAAYSAIKGTDFSEAWNVAKNTLVELLATAKQVGGILMDALAGGDYDIAFRAVMAGIKVALADSLDAMSNLWGMFWRGAFEMAKRFATSLLTMMGNVVTTIAKAMADPLTAANNIGKQLARIANGELKLSLGIDTAKMRADAKAELAALEAEMAARKAKRAAGVDAAKDPEVDAIQNQIDVLKKAQAAWADMDQAQIDIADPQFNKEQWMGGGTTYAAQKTAAETKASVASFSLAELAGNSNRGTAEKHLTVAQQQKKLQEQALIVGMQTMAAIQGMGLSFP